MTEFKSRWKSLTNRGQWAVRGSAFTGKVKATKAVWFPPKPLETGKKAASAAKEQSGKTTKKATRKTSGAAKATTGAGKKTTSTAKKVASRPRRSKSTSST